MRQVYKCFLATFAALFFCQRSKLTIIPKYKYASWTVIASLLYFLVSLVEISFHSCANLINIKFIFQKFFNYCVCFNCCEYCLPRQLVCVRRVLSNQFRRLYVFHQTVQLLHCLPADVVFQSHFVTSLLCRWPPVHQCFCTHYILLPRYPFRLDQVNDHVA